MKVEKLAALRSSGSIDDGEFERLKNDLLGTLVLGSVLVEIGLDVGLSNLHLGRIGLDCQGCEVAGLLFQLGESLDFGIGDKAAAGEGGAQLADEHFLLQHLTELQTGVAHLLQHLVITRGAELTLDLEFGSLQDQLIESRFRKGELGTLRSLQQQLTIDQPLESRFAQELLIQQAAVEVLAQLLHQLATLGIGGLRQRALTDFLTIDLGRGLRRAGTGHDRVKAGQGHERNDDANDGFGNPPL